MHVVSFYKFIEIDNPAAEVKRHKKFCESLDLLGRIYIAENGINAQFSATPSDARAYIEFCEATNAKIQEYPEHAFPRLTIKNRPLVALNLDNKNGATHVSPAKWRQLLESGEAHILDVRNDYEWEIGHFKNSEKPKAKTFYDFPKVAEELAATKDPETPIMMCCTGGIRCEVYSPILRKLGFKNIYQLDGGILKYGEEEGGKHWEGKLFVFDDRLAVTVNPDAKPTSKCHHCRESADSYHNCANMDCNELFISCPSCLENHQGCCQESCKSAPRVRPLSTKPFRRYHLIANA